MQRCFSEQHFEGNHVVDTWISGVYFQCAWMAFGCRDLVLACLGFDGSLGNEVREC